MSVPKLAHIVLQTNRLQEMRDWYCRLLDARVVYENPVMVFLTINARPGRGMHADSTEAAIRTAELVGRGQQ
jgi:catechol 2,3-dioxygenase-like lactoylglutathione lyase family enzyme